MGTAVLATASLAFGSSRLPAAEPPLPELPVLRLEGVEPEVRTQMEGAAAAARARPRDGEAGGRLGMTLHAYELYEPAAVCYERAWRLAPREPRWHCYQGLVQTALGDTREARAAFEAALRLRPDDAPARLRLADMLLAAGELVQSQALYEALLGAGAGVAQARYGLGQIEAAKGQPAAALEHYRQAVAAFPGYGRAHYALALALREQGRAEEAARHLSLFQQNRYGEPVLEDSLLQAVAELNASASDHLLQGTVLEAMGRLEPSIAAHERALAKNPALVQAHVNLIALLTRMRQFEKAEEHYWAAVATNPELADAHFNYGLLLVEMGRPTQAEEAFRRSLERNPWNAEAHFNYARIVERDGRSEEAARHYRQALANDPGHKLAHYSLGKLLVQEEKLEEAVFHYRETLTPEDDGMDGMARAGMGADAGDFDDDGDLDLFVTNLVREGSVLFRNDGRGGFQDVSLPSGLGRATFLRTGFGTSWLDYDGDGRLDLFAANGTRERFPATEADRTITLRQGAGEAEPRGSGAR